MWVDIVNNETDMVRSIDLPPELELHPGIIYLSLIMNGIDGVYF